MARPSGDPNVRWARFLELYAETGMVTRSCAAIGVSASAHKERLRNKPGYREQFAEAHQKWVEKLEAEAFRRGVEGVEEPVGFYKGEPGAYVRKYSDDLLKMMMKANAPEKYGDKVEHRGVFARMDVSQLSDEQLLRITSGENPMTVLGGALRELPVLEAEVVDDREEEAEEH